MKVRALKYLRGAAIVKDPGDEFDLDAEDAAPLLADGAIEAVPVVERADEPPAERAVAPAPEKPAPKATRPSRKRKPKKVSGK